MAVRYTSGPSSSMISFDGHSLKIVVLASLWFEGHDVT